MKFKPAITIFILLSFSCSFLRKSENDLDKVNLKGHVASVKAETFYAYQEGDEIAALGTDEVYIGNYNKHGFISNMQIDDNRAGGCKERAKYNYNDEGVLLNIDAVIVTKNNAPSFSGRYKYTYDCGANDLRLQENIYFNGKLVVVSKYSYNLAGKLVEISKFDKYDKLFGKDTFEYDFLGKLNTRRHAGGDGVFSTITTYGYDKDGNITSYNVGSVKNKNQASGSFKYDDYDEAGNWRIKVSYKNGKVDKLVKRAITNYD